MTAENVRRIDRASKVLLIFLIGLLSGIVLDQWGLAHQGVGFCGPQLAGKVISCP